MHRFFLEALPEGATALLGGEEARHLRDVRRVCVGECVVLFDGRGGSLEGVVEDLDRNGARIRIEARRPSAPPPTPRVILATAVPKGDRWDWLLEKATEAGADEIRPVLFARGVARPDGTKRAKWERIAREACKQCGRNVLPEIGDPVGFSEAIESLKAASPTRFWADPAPDAEPVAKAFRAAGAPLACAVLIGPEGGLERHESEACAAAGFRRVSLGPNVLRIETAALAAIVAIRTAAEGG